MSVLSESAALQSPSPAPPIEPSLAEASDYFALMKPRVMSLVVFTAFVGMMVAPGQLHPVLGVASLLCIAVGAGAAGVLNMWYDADIDGVMGRTRQRPIPAGRVQPGEALAFGVTLGVGAVAVLGLVASWFTAGLLAFTIFFYAVIYTIWLKRWTAQNIVIGGAAGALPPVIGWAAVTQDVGLAPILLFLIVFFWTPPHFWALSLRRCEEYRRAGVPMLPVVAGAAETKRQILAHALLLAPAGVTPFLFGFAGPMYGIVAAIAGAMMVLLALRLKNAGTDNAAHAAAKRLFSFSLLYLFALFAVLLVDHWLGRWPAILLG
ncbi:MAG: heme o synthase [Rhodoplanes sp.]